MRVRFLHKIAAWRIVATALLLLSNFSFAQGNIVSLKKGNLDGSSWVVIYFDGSIKWNGLAQSNDNSLSLYFDGGVGYKNNTKISISEQYSRSIQCTQLRSNPPVSKVDIRYEKDIPILVLKKQDILIVSINSKSFMDAKRKFDLTNTDEMIEIESIVKRQEGEKERLEFQYTGKMEIAGFFRTDRNNPKLILGKSVHDHTMGTFWYDASSIPFISVETLDQEFNTPSINFKLENAYTYSIADKKGQLVLEVIPVSPERQLMEQDRTYTAPAGMDSSKEAVEDTTNLNVNADNLVDLAIQGTDFDNFDNPNMREQTEGANIDLVNNVFEKSQLPINPSIQAAFNPKSPTMEMQSSTVNTSLSEGDHIPWDAFVSLSFKDTPIKDALRAIAISNDLNMVIADGVEGSVTLNLKNITLRQALDKIIHIHNAEYVVDGSILTIKPVTVAYTGGRVTRIYRLKYADAVNVKSVIDNIVTSDSPVEVFHPEFLNYEEAGKNRKDAGEVAVQGIRRASILVVTDRPEKIKEIDNIIAELDQPPRQILIRSKLVEMSPQYTREIGIDWDQTLGILGEKSESPSGDESSFRLASGSGNIDITKTMTLGQVNSFQYTAVMDFIQNKTDSKLISNPSLLAADNEEASISVGTTVPIPVLEVGNSGNSDRITFEYKEVNIQLNVSPHIGDNNEIVMFINPVIEEITSWVEYDTQRAPITTKRAVNSIVKIKNGATLVIGGLIKNQRNKTIKKLFLLGDLPLIGSLFQHESYEDTQTNLLIFITPTIVDEI